MFELNEKHFIDGCIHDHPKHHPKPHYTVQEEMAHITIEMKEAIGRMIEFERRLDEKVDDMLKHLTSDNVIFKNTFTEAYNRFLNDVKNEVNIFEGNTTNAWTLFKTSIESAYARLDEECKVQIADYYNDIILYIKNNIVDAVGNILNEMKENGELTEVFENTVIPNLNEKISATKTDYYTVDNTNLANAVSTCKTKGKIFYVPYGKTLIIDETLDLRGIDIQIHGTLQVNHNGVGVLIGDTALRTANLYIREVTAPNYMSGDISVRVVGVKRARVTIDYAPTIQLYANGDVEGETSIAYSVFNVLSCRKFMICDQEGTDNQGWINENTFHVERITEELSIIGNTYQHNNNVFYKPCVEGGKVILRNCRRNKIYDLRNENMKSITLDSNTWQNEIIYNYYTTIPYNRGTFTDEGRDNVVECSVWRNNRYIPVCTFTPKSVSKGVYKIADEDYFTVSDTAITPTSTFKNIVDELVIPAKYINRIRATSDTGCIRVRVALLDDGMNPITGGVSFGGQETANPVYYYGVDDSKLVVDDNGLYNPQTSAVAQTIDILNKDASYIKISVQSAEKASAFKYLTLLVGCNERDSAHLEYLKYSTME